MLGEIADLRLCALMSLRIMSLHPYVCALLRSGFVLPCFPFTWTKSITKFIQKNDKFQT